MLIITEAWLIYWMERIVIGITGVIEGHNFKLEALRTGSPFPEAVSHLEVTHGHGLGHETV